MMKFEREYYLRASDFDKHMNLTPTGILDLFQDVAGAHAMEIGCGLYDMTAKKIAWVLMGVKYTVLKPTKLYSKVRVVTWPLSVKGVRYNREYLILDPSGEVLVKGTSVWVVIDLDEKKILTNAGVYDDLTEFCTDVNYAEKYVKSRPFSDGDVRSEFVVNKSDIDFNNHANNTRYARFIYDALPLEDGEYFTELQIDYHRELLLGDQFTVSCKRDGDRYLVTGTSDGETAFTSYATVGKSFNF